jgi:4-hydroxybenzoate polyprenyltransferase
MLKTYFKLFRVPQWIKNLFVFVPLLFSQNLFEWRTLLTSIEAFIIFCLSSSIIYVINDIVDIKADAAHPVKKLRPLPSGKISKKSALTSVIILIAITIFLVSFFNLRFILCIALFFLLNVLYTFYFKHIVLLDIFSIAAGFMLRIIGGALVISIEISNWLLLTTMFISLFLGVMKRYSELTIRLEDKTGITRKVLADYSLEFTRQLSTIAAAGVIICYALYSVSQRTVRVFGTENLIYTTPFVVFGIFRYMYLVFMNNEGENTTQMMLTDLPMILTVLLYILTTITIVYNII